MVKSRYLCSDLTQPFSFLLHKRPLVTVRLSRDHSRGLNLFT